MVAARSSSICALSSSMRNVMDFVICSPLTNHLTIIRRLAASRKNLQLLQGARIAVDNPCAVEGTVFQWVRIPPGNWSFQPEATGATTEVTKSLKHSGVTGHFW